MNRHLFLPPIVQLPIAACVGAAWIVLAVNEVASSPLSNEDKPCYVVPDGIEYNQAIPTPKNYLGFELGEFHIRHHQLVGYVRAVAEVSGRIKMGQYAQSHGRRPLVMLTITSPANHARLDTIQQQRQALADPRLEIDFDIDAMPAVINMGYSVHGDESSAGNAVPGLVYYLAAAQGDEIERLLDNLIILVDPCLNPDGFDRFATWANSYRGINRNDDPRHIEHNQGWPGGRVNYYWFDLNRDWLPGQHPESQGRLSRYHQWKPNIVLDFHEMGTNSTFFFQPGVPERTNPLTPSGNVELTRKMADYHAQALDRIGSLYFTEERFDDFYMGKGSTYPDLHGSVGILFEQASSRGHVQQSENGRLTFPFTIRNQFTCSLSSLRAALDMRQELNRHLNRFYKESLEMGGRADAGAHAFTARGDLTRLSEFAAILRRHDIQCYWLTRDLGVGDVDLPPYRTLVVPCAQPEYRFLLSLIETRTEFQESIFYDVSTWTVPLAFDLDGSTLSSMPSADWLIDVDQLPDESNGDELSDDTVAYVLPWTDYDAPRALYALLDAGLKVKVAQAPFSVMAGGEERRFGYGTLVVPVGIQELPAEDVSRSMGQSNRPTMYRITSGLTPSGIDLGSDHFSTLQKPNAIMLIGSGISRYEAGEVWHFMDTRVHMPLTIVDIDRFGRVDLDEYNVMILVRGSYSGLSESKTESIREWIAAGGTLISTSSAARWVGAQPWADIEYVSDEETDEVKESDKSGKEEDPIKQSPYADARNQRALELISGAIIRARVDTTHPVGYGFSNSVLPVFRNNRIFIKPSNNPYANPVVYAKQPLMSGYVSAENLQRIAQSAGVVVKAHGAGRAILISDNPNFRAFWYGTNRLFFNSVFFGQLVRVP